MSVREVLLALALIVGAALVVAGVARWSVGAAYIAAGLAVASVGILFTTEVD